MSDRILKWPELAKRLGNPARITVSRWVNDGKFPAPVKLSAGSVGWLETEIDEWLAARAAERTSGAAA